MKAEPGLLAFAWLPIDTWTVVIAALSGAACGLVGCFLVLRKMSMMGDAISHAVLPGLAAAFLLTGTRNSAAMLLGAATVGVLTAFFTEWIRRRGRVDEGASMGVVFTVLFAIGLVMIRFAADHVDLDPDCVLYGALESAALNVSPWLGLGVPRAAWVNGGVFLLNLAFVVMFFKELRISSFDPALATTVGVNAALMHYLLMTLVAVTTVFAFETVGSILVIAMLIVPAATAQLLTHRLGTMLVLCVLIAAICAVQGHLNAMLLPPLLGYAGVSTSTAGMIAVTLGAAFTLALFFAPREGLVSRMVQRLSLSRRIAAEDMLALLFRLEERGGATPATMDLTLLGTTIGASPLVRRLASIHLHRQGWVQSQPAGVSLTPTGRERAQHMIRSHRLWETYLEKHLELPSDHVHAPAERLEHITSAAMRADLANSTASPDHDPQGRPIPPEAMN